MYVCMYVCMYARRELARLTECCTAVFPLGMTRGFLGTFVGSAISAVHHLPSGGKGVLPMFPRTAQDHINIRILHSGSEGDTRKGGS